jgi:uncharacterized membrane protein YdjX (TVP38/TMEM64 family)
MNKVYKSLQLILIGVIILLILGLAPFLRDATLSDLMQILPDTRGAAALTLFLLFCAKAVVVIIPIIVLYLGAGIVFSPFQAIMFTIVCLTAEMTIGYWIGRKLGRHHVQELLNRYKMAGKVTEYIRDNSFISVIAVRLVPGPPPDLISMLLGAARVEYRDYLAASLLGLLPLMIPVVLIGNAISNPETNGVSILIGISILMTITAFFLNRMLVRRYLQETVKAEEGSPAA